jgi:hypothetical protein
MRINSGTIKSIASVTLAVVLTLSLAAPALVGTALATDPNEIDTTTEFANVYNSNNVDGASVASPGAAIEPGGYMRLSATADDNITVSMGNVSDSSDVEVEFRENDDSLLGADTVSSGTADFEPGQDTVETVIIRNRLDRGISVDKITTDGGESSTSTDSTDTDSEGQLSSPVRNQDNVQCNADDAIAFVGGAAASIVDPYTGVKTTSKEAIECAADFINDEDYRAALENNQTESDVYGAGIAIEQDNDNLDTLSENYLQDTRTTAFAEGQKEVFNALSANLSESEVRTRGKEAVEDYYATKQINYLRTVEGQLQRARLIDDRADAESGVSGDIINLETGTTGSEPQNDYDFAGNVTVNVELVNGSTYAYKSVYVSTGSDYWLRWFSSTSSAQSFSSGATTPDKFGRLDAKSTAGNPSRIIINASDTNRIWTSIEDKSQQVSDNIDKFANKTYDEYQAGNISVSGAINPLTLARSYSTDYNDTGYYIFAQATLASAGYETPNLDNAAETNIEMLDGTQRNGLLATSDGPPGGTWETGTTYQPDRIQGPVLFLEKDGTLRELNDPFTVTEIRDYNGSEIDSTDTQNFTYQPVNTDEYLKIQKNLTEFRNIIEEKQSNAGAGGAGGGGGGFDFGGLDGLDGLIPGIGGAATLILIGVVAALLLSNN